MTGAQKIWAMLSPLQRRAAVSQLALMLGGMILETASAGAVIPALSVMTAEGTAARDAFPGPFFDRVAHFSGEQLVMAGLALLVVLYAVKAVYLAFVAWQQARFVSRLQAAVAERLFASYLRQPYAFHLQHNSAQLINHTANVTGVCNAVTAWLGLITELLVLLGISSLLLLVEPLGAVLVVSTLGLAGLAFHRLTKSQLKQTGEARWFHNRQLLQHQQQAFGGAKDVKLLGREDHFILQFSAHASASANASERQATLQALPRLWLEFLAMVGLAALIFVMMLQGKSSQVALPTAGLFAAAAFRIMPSFHRVIGCLQALRHYTTVVDTLHAEVRQADEILTPVSGSRFPFRKALALENVSFAYPGSDTPAVTNVTLVIPRGVSIGFVGSSGAGKSTLVDVILGLLAPTAGRVTVDGVDAQENLRGWQDQIGYVPQSIFLTDDTLRRNIALGLSDDAIDEDAIRRSIRSAQLESFVKELPQGLETVVGERGVRLSGGQRQRIGIARALYHDPPVLVLDEATNALDHATEASIMDAVYLLRGDKTLLLVAHRLSTLARCDHICRLERGQLLQEGSPTPVFSTAGKT